MNFDLPSLVLNSESRKRRKSKPRTIILRPIDPTPAIELDFLTALNQLVRGIYRATRDYVSPVTKQERNRYHSDDVGGNARSVIEALRQEAARLEAETSAKGSAATSAEGRRHTSRWSATVASQANIDIRYLLRDDDLVDLLSMRSEEFNRLIKSLSSEALDRIERITLGSIFEGKSNADIAKQLQEAEGLSRNRARLIARDQASKLNGAMNQFRHEQAGVTHYKWKTILDGRERPSHHANNNKIFPWAKAPPTGHPSFAVNCRCRGLAVLTDEPEALASLPDEPLGDFFENNLPLIREVAPTPSQPVFGFPDELLLQRLTQTQTLRSEISAARSVLTEAEAERLLIEMYGFRVANADIDGLLGSRLRAALKSQRAKYIAAVEARLETIERLLVQARLAPKDDPVPRQMPNLVPPRAANEPPRIRPMVSSDPIPAGRYHKRIDGDERPIKRAVTESGDFVRRQGDFTGHEWLIAHDDLGRPLAITSQGKARAVGVDNIILPELYSPRHRVTIHHNHPTSSSFSLADIEMFDGSPGLERLYAHGADGSYYQVKVLDPSRILEQVKRADAAARRAIARYAFDRSEFDAVSNHYFMEVLRKKGYIQYSAVMRGATRTAYKKFIELIDQASDDAKNLILD